MDDFYDFDRQMEAEEALQRYFYRTHRYYVLKAWWEAQRTLKRARTPKQRYEAIKGIKTLKENYGTLLNDALERWARVTSYRQTVKTCQRDHRLKPGEMEKLWEDTVILG